MEELTRELRRPYPKFKVEITATMALLLLPLSGIFISFSLADWQYFERSGSLMVIVGIILAWKDINGTLNWFEGYVESTVSYQLKELEKQKISLRDALIESAISGVKYIGKELREQIGLLKKRIRFLEVVALGLGTLIWGYGSIIADLVYKLP
ncbi:hypothetical protein OAE16_08545 [Porticoccaceae bacterium]|nr:hypothetical protein [Porticoccaceae bacterium]